MEPGDTAGISLETAAPEAPGEYVLELFVVQEGAGGERGAGALKSPLKVLPPG